jgi:2-haloalkanoic acid dehalogenase type II
MSKLTDFKLLSFDVYGTLIDYESGIVTAMQPVVKKSGRSVDPKDILRASNAAQSAQQTANPSQPYSELLATVHPKICSELGLDPPTEQESRDFGNSIPEFKAYEDTVSALHRLKKHYKMVVLSNVDNASFAANNAASTGLQGFEWDLVLTAQDIGSYKPNLKNFEYMLREVKERWGVEKEEVLQTAQSQHHDHHPAREMGMKSAWIYRPAQYLGNRADPCWTWKFDTLEEMADAVERELAEGK